MRKWKREQRSQKRENESKLRSQSQSHNPKQTGALQKATLTANKDGTLAHLVTMEVTGVVVRDLPRGSHPRFSLHFAV